MDFDISRFRIKKGERFRLGDRPTRVEPLYASKDEYGQVLEDLLGKLGELQERLYAVNTHALLVILQGMDTSGKDGIIRHVMTGINPHGCEVASFQQPSKTELSHDFLWRTVAKLPQRGNIGVFNRSYYEEVLVVRVHPEHLKAQGLPPQVNNDSSFWQNRFESIRDHERHLTDSGFHVLKFFLHVSKEEQRQRLIARLDDPAKRWKFNPGDVAERPYWDHYMDAYADCLSETSTDSCPWYVIPADDKPNARVLVAHALVRKLQELDLRFPELAMNENDLNIVRQALAS